MCAPLCGRRDDFFPALRFWTAVYILENELNILTVLKDEFASVAEKQSKRLVEAHERFSALMDGKRFQVVYPVLPMDLLGVYVLLPDAKPQHD